jgi:hypothetical protein
MPRLVAALTMVSCACAIAVSTAAATPKLWATVNVCDTEQAPDAMGVRAGMPGNGTGQRIYMRFSAEHWSPTRQVWLPLRDTGTSPWIPAGQRRKQAGWTFEFAPPAEGVTFTMRAVVDFEWRAAKPRRRARQPGILRRATRPTETGIPGVRRGDPPGTSKALCLLH